MTTPAQQEWLGALSMAGMDAAVWRPDDWPHRILQQIRAVSVRSARMSTTQETS